MVLNAQVKLVYTKIHLQRMVLNPILYFQCIPRGESAGRHATRFARNFSDESQPRPLPPRHSGVVIAWLVPALLCKQLPSLPTHLLLGEALCVDGVGKGW